MDLISIILPVYNREDFITECIRSILESSHRNLEILVIDDGSTDSTLELCRGLQAEDDRIRIFECDHGGVSAARNRGLDEALGNYVFFVDSDDRIHPALLQVLCTSLRDSDAQISATGIMNIPQHSWHKLSEYIEKSPKDCAVEYKINGEAITEMFRSITPINLIGGVMMSRELIGQTRFRCDLFIGEDYYFVYENVIKGCPVVFTKSKWYFARLHPGNASNNYDYEAFLTRFNRRVMVWKSEEALGRPENAARQKRDAFGCYARCLLMNDPHSPEVQKMRTELKKYKKEIASSLSLKGRLSLSVSLHFPGLYSRLRNPARKA